MLRGLVRFTSCHSSLRPRHGLGQRDAIKARKTPDWTRMCAHEAFLSGEVPKRPQRHRLEIGWGR